MENQSNKFVLKEVKMHFSFLFDMGYRVRSVDYRPQESGNWLVTLESDKCLLEISKDRNEVMVYFIPLSGNENYRIGLKAMIYFLSQGKELIEPFKGNLFWGMRKQYKELAELLGIYHDRIVPFFGIDFVDYMKDLLYAERNYFMKIVKTIKE